MYPVYCILKIFEDLDFLCRKCLVSKDLLQPQVFLGSLPQQGQDCLPSKVCGSWPRGPSDEGSPDEPHQRCLQVFQSAQRTPTGGQTQSQNATANNKSQVSCSFNSFLANFCFIL